MKKWIRWALFGVGTLLLAAAILVVSAYRIDVQASQRASERHQPRGEFIDVDGAQMHVICRGQGEPTLVLQAGIGGDALDWLPVMNALDDTARVCAFDRLGQGWSDPAPTPRAFGNAADDLHTALMALEIDRPVVIGHSLGGAVVQIYAGRYDVAGVVLVDGLTLDATPAVTRRLGTYQSLDWAGRLGLLRPLGSMLVDANYADELQNEMQTLRARSSALLGFSAEGAIAAETAFDELNAAESTITAPMLIVAAGQNGLPEEGIFLQALRNLAERQDETTFLLVPDASHYLLASHPQLVADQISEWVQSNLSQ